MRGLTKVGIVSFLFFGVAIALLLVTQETKAFIPDQSPPSIDFVSPTPANDSTADQDHIYLNLTTDGNLTHYSFVDFRDELIIWLPFDVVNSSGDPSDLGPHGDNATLVGNALINSTGLFGDAMHLDGSGDYADASEANFNSSANWTFNAWIYPHVMGANQIFFFVGNGSTTEAARFMILGSGTLRFATDYGASISAGMPPAQTWSMVSVTKNDTGYAIFVDGVRPLGGIDTSFSQTPGFMSMLHIGAWHDGSNGLNGVMDEVLIFNRSLSPSDLQSLFNASATQFERNVTGLIDGDYNFTGYTMDTDGEFNTTHHFVTLGEEVADEDNPEVFILSPKNITYENNTVNFNASVNETNPNTGVVQVTMLDTGQGGINYTLTNRSGDWGYTNLSIPNGVYIAQYFLEDDAGNVNLTENVTFTMDSCQYSGIGDYTPVCNCIGENRIVSDIDLGGNNFILIGPGPGYTIDGAIISGVTENHLDACRRTRINGGQITP